MAGLATLKVPPVQPLVQETNKLVIDLMETFDVEPFTDPAQIKTHFAEVTHLKKPNLLGALFLAAVAAYTYYRTAHQYATFGLGALAVLTFYTSIEKIFNPSTEFKTFSDNCNLIAEHLTNAFVSKATFMVDQINLNSSWNVNADILLADSYEQQTLSRNINPS